MQNEWLCISAKPPFLFQIFSSGFAQLGDELLIELCELIPISVYKDILIHFFVIHALFLNKTVTVKHLLRCRGYPHKRIGILGEKIKLARSLKDEYAAVDIVGKLVLHHFRKR